MIRYAFDPVNPYLCALKNDITGKTKIEMYSLGLMWYSFKAALHLTKRIKVFK